MIDEAGVEVAAHRARRQMRDRHRRECRAALSRPTEKQPAGAGLDAISIVCPPGEGDQVLRPIRPRLRRADRGAHRTAGPRRRARRRGHRRSRRLLRRLAPARRALRPDSDHPARAGRFERRRQDGNQLAARQESGRRVPPAVFGARRFRQPRHAERAGVPRRLRRSGQVRPDRRPELLRVPRSPLARHLLRRTGAGRGDREELRSQGARRRRRRDRAGPNGRCSISATPSATRWRA